MKIVSSFSKFARFPAVAIAAAVLAAPAGAAVIPDVTYTYSTAPSTSYDDPGMTTLVDGVRVTPAFNATGFADVVAGWIQNPGNPDAPHPAIDFNLGNVFNLTGVEISYALWPGAGVRAPNEVRVSFSNDGVNFFGEQTFGGFDGTDHAEGYAVFSRLLDIDVTGETAAYVRLDFRQGPSDAWGENRSAWHMIDEVTFTGTVIPEPSTVAFLLGLAAGGLLLFRRRRG